ncbi:MAG TPA: hypothetical protein VFF40_10040 [Acidimicrobiia bacterium]|nr:hypothetical protein [Acidimicrobiia bacterium]
MARKRTRTALRDASQTLLEPGEQFVTGCAVWMADHRPRVPLFFTGRAIYLLALTSDRLLVFDTPRRGRPLFDVDLLLQRRFDTLELVASRSWMPMAQIRVAPAPGREVILEFRPRDRAVGRTLVRAMRDSRPVTPAGDGSPVVGSA